MKKLSMIIIALIISVGATTIGTFLHELYHYVTLDKVTGFGLCGTGAFVKGYGYSSEIVAWFITIGTIFVILTIIIKCL